MIQAGKRIGHDAIEEGNYNRSDKLTRAQLTSRWNWNSEHQVNANIKSQRKKETIERFQTINKDTKVDLQTITNFRFQ